MTCEVAVANKLAIALAADSAVTFSGAGSQNTYASGANKIFQLAHSQPVAVMIYNNASLGSVPWELIIKSYRTNLSVKGFPRLGGYCDDLVSFINSCSEDLIPDSLKESGTLFVYGAAVMRVISGITSRFPQLLHTDVDSEQARGYWSTAIDEMESWLDSEPVCDSLDAAELESELRVRSLSLSADVADFLLKSSEYSSLAAFVDNRRLANVGIKTAFKKGFEVLPDSYTGLVVAGFGVDDYMPGFVDLKFFGFIGSRVLFRRDTTQSVNHNGTASIIEAFARRAMVETFTQGASPQVWTAVGNAFETYAAKVCQTAAEAAGLTIAPEHLEKGITAHSQEFTNDWTRTVFADHLRPLWTVVASLSISELAELAETLVLLESLKEKVTQRTQSVGGPIDVAVITKAEGLVWIKRKLYFEPHLNHRYFRRVETEEGHHHAR
ncbi:hypothetical protein JC796_17460 [Delftia acidovorans]|uniref:hypothetical protein n=1 Tax=Delftia acidovorans TaxID=80866 RepID=UPI0018E72E85|nr:hypothetical protein [Delftia acidovorans]MBJ2142534.1 hypothetical protein [Delftia acidovorans]